jgi:hypothetical protein
VVCNDRLFKSFQKYFVMQTTNKRILSNLTVAPIGEIENNVKIAKAIKKQHLDERAKLILRLLRKSKQALIEDFMKEMDAKNDAYYFILGYGHFNSFQIYCHHNTRSSAFKKAN